MKKIRAWIERHCDILSYLFFGVLTTGVNYLLFLPCYNLWGFSGSVSNMIAWVFAVAFAYLTNKPFVFRSHDWSARRVVPELTKFVGCRLGSGALETALIWLTVDKLGWNGNVVKLAAGVMVMVLNYLAGRLLVFRSK